MFDVAIVGAGPGGYVAAIRAAQLGLKVVCIEKRKELGGTCLNVGCIPSKTLLQYSEDYERAKRTFSKDLSYDFGAMMQKKAGVLSSFNQGIQGLFKKNKVTSINATATFEDPHTLSLSNGEKVEAKSIILATGSEPIPLPFLPFDEKVVLSSTGALSLDAPPKKLLIVGAGVIGVELGSVYARLGSEVTFVEFFPTICPTFDASISQELLTLLKKQGMQFMLSSKVTAATPSESGISLTVENQEKAHTLEGSHVLVSIGRRPYTQGLGLEKIGVTPNQKGLIDVNGSFQTTHPHIFAIGDLIDGPMLAHKASEEGTVVSEIIAGLTPKLDYMAIPSVIYTHPEAASVGLTEEEAKKLGLTPVTGTFPMMANSRAQCAGEPSGFVKVIADKETDKILGIHILATHASELIAMAGFALHKRATIHDLIHTPIAHPTMSEALKEAALSVHKRAIHR